ncbi:MAG TPA: ubiquinone/menaquinone biosynthesis methyltransferase [Thermoanaerobaculaceae bacterium]|nr:ubiquinone/menaquinone biosynthesis methyltransferase [Thermoanaerobaculaceae bacterium]
MDPRLARDPAAIRAMFSGVAPRYDLLNRLLSLRQDVRWRRRLVAALSAAPRGPVLDLAAGTGDVALAIRARAVVGGDFSLPMLRVAGRKARALGRRVAWVAADALALPFRGGAFAAVTIAFGVRNFADLAFGFREIGRVLAPGGILGVLELQRPARPTVAAAMKAWNRAVVRPLGRLISHDGDAYDYLPASVDTFPDRLGIAAVLTGLGYAVLEGRDLSGGVAGLTVARWEGA